MRGRDWSLAGLVVSGLGGLLVLIPLFDIWDDLTNPPYKSLFSTTLENSVLLVLSLVLVGIGLWLTHNDWEDGYVKVTATWFALGTGAVGLAVGWIIAWQLLVQNDIKPYVLAADTVVLGSIAAVAVGIHSARRRMQQDALETERDRLSALFENTTDAMASIEFSADTPIINEINGSFAETFGVDRSTAVGEPLDDLVVPEGKHDEARTINHEARSGKNVEREVVRTTPDGERIFLLRIVPYDESGGHRRAFASYTDITDRKELSRTREQRNKIASLHTYVSRLQRSDTEDDVCDVAIEAVQDILDADTAALVVDGQEGTETATGDTETLQQRFVDGARDAEGIVTETTVAGGTVLAAAGEGVVVQATTESGEFTEADEQVLELLVNHVSESIERVRREQEVQRERERLEFMNRILRHNLLNGLNVVDARLKMLEDRVDDEVARHRETAANRVSNMTDLIETMRTFMKVIVEGEEHKLEPVDLGSVLEDEVDSAQGAFPDASFELAGDIPDVAVAADALLPEVFENVLTNAVRHNDKETPEVSVRAERENGTVAVEVADNGPGIPDDRKEEVFDKGIKGLQSPGSGFGLYLVKEIIDSYGGEVTVEDNDPEGSVFRVVIPVASDDEP